MWVAARLAGAHWSPRPKTPPGRPLECTSRAEVLDGRGSRFQNPCQTAASVRPRGAGKVSVEPLITRRVHATLRAAAKSGATTVRVLAGSGALDHDRHCGPGRLGVAGPGISRGWTPARTGPSTTGLASPSSRWPASAPACTNWCPTEWGPPTFEIDGIKMLPTARVSPYADAERKVGLIEPRGKRILDTCGGLGYFAAWCLLGQASQVLSWEKSPDVIWLRRLNPWSPEGSGKSDDRLTLDPGRHQRRRSASWLPGPSTRSCMTRPASAPPANSIRSPSMTELARVLRHRGRLFHYTGTPNKLTSGRDVPAEVAKRLRLAGFVDGTKRRRHPGCKGPLGAGAPFSPAHPVPGAARSPGQRQHRPCSPWC